MAIDSSRNTRLIDAVDCAWVITAVYILLGYFTPWAFDSLGVILYTSILMLLTVIHAAKSNYAQNKLDSGFLLILIVLFSITINLALSPYSHSTLARIVLFAIDVWLLICIFEVQNRAYAGKVFYYISTCVLLVSFFIYIVSPTVFLSISGSFRTADELAPLLLGAADKNRTALFLFVYFCYCLKGRKLIGICLCLVYPLLYFGRQYIIMVFVAIVLICIRRYSPAVFELFKNFVRPRNIFLFIVLASIGMICFSYFWTGTVMSGNITDYKAGWNDTSNAVRMTSMQYVFERMCEDPSFLIYGYDSDLFERLGISTSDTTRGATLYVQDRFRLVQPHEDFINTVLKEGLLFSLVYYALVSYLIARVSRSEKDTIIVISYLTGTLVLHEMLTAQALLLFVFVLCAAPEQKSQTALSANAESSPNSSSKDMTGS